MNSNPETIRVQLKTVAAKSGFLWLRQSCVIFTKKPFIFCALLMLMLMAAMLLALVPWLFLMLLPMVAWVFMLISWRIDGRPVGAKTRQPWQRQHGYAMLQLGVLYMLITVLIFSVCHWLDGGKFLALQHALGSAEMTPAKLQVSMNDPQLQQGLWLCFFLLTVRSLLFWHTPALVYWGQQAVFKALFFNGMSIWRHKKAWAIYGLTLGAALVTIEWVSWLAMGVLGQPQWAMLIMVPCMFVLICVSYISGFFSFIDAYEITSKNEIVG
jgi:hypothetical protein